MKRNTINVPFSYAAFCFLAADWSTAEIYLEKTELMNVGDIRN